MNGIDIGTWLQQQTSPAGWAQLTAGQQALLQQLGVPALTTAASAGCRDGSGAPESGGPAPVTGLESLDPFGRGLAAARQYLDREGHLTVPRKHQEVLHPGHEDGTPAADGAPVTVQLGVWLTNQKTRRANLSQERRAALAGLGLHWAK